MRKPLAVVILLGITGLTVGPMLLSGPRRSVPLPAQPRPLPEPTDDPILPGLSEPRAFEATALPPVLGELPAQTDLEVPRIVVSVPEPQAAPVPAPAPSQSPETSPDPSAEPESTPTPAPTPTPTPVPTPEPTPEILFTAGSVAPPSGKEKTVAARLRQYGPAARKRMATWFKKAGVDYPPSQVLLVGLKQERLLQVYAASPRTRGQWKFVSQYPVAAGGVSIGPKLRQGDRQTPEGFYRITYLNPTSSYHLSMRLDYPNAFDLQQAKRDKRTKLGGDIMIHGDCYSDGCLAMGNTAATDLFVLVADTGQTNAQVLISPVDFRLRKVPLFTKRPRWTNQLYDQIRTTLRQLDDGRDPDSRLVRYRDSVPTWLTPQVPASQLAKGQ